MLVFKKIKTKNGKGFTLIEALTLVFLLGLLTVTFYNVMMLGMRYIAASKNRLGAVAVANEKMEIARNLKYDDVGTIDGFCPGVIPQDEDITESGRKYHVHTYAKFIDDAYDGTFNGSPNDIAYNDYKKLEITVSWNVGGSDQGSVKVVSSFMSPSLEVATPGDGILSVNIFSDQSGVVPVSGATVHVVNTDVGINDTASTDSSGNVMFLGAKESLQKYHITVSKSGYETVTTLPPYPTTAYNPVDMDASVISGTINTTNISQNKLADLKIATLDYLGNPVSGVGIEVDGGRKLGTKYETPFDPVYNLSFDGSTGSDGKKDFGSISPGQYTFKLSDSETTYEMIGGDVVSPLALAPESNEEVKMKVADKNMTGLLVKLVNDTDGSPLVGATVELVNVGFSYDKTITTDAQGMAFFPDSDTPVFQAGTYDLTVKADGFQDNTTTETISDNNLSIENITMVTN